jgi:hypothetical protein
VRNLFDHYEEWAGVALRLLEQEERVPVLAPIAPAIEAIEHDDWKARTPTGALDRAVRVFLACAELEVADLEQAIAAERPDAVLLDFNCFGAAARAEKDGRPWALFMSYFLPGGRSMRRHLGRGCGRRRGSLAGCAIASSRDGSTARSSATCLRSMPCGAGSVCRRCRA